MMTGHLQEFCDMEGDARANRKTLPLVVGFTWIPRLRQATMLMVVVFSWTLVLLRTIKCNISCPSNMFLTVALLGIGSIITGVRCICGNSKEMDAKTYKLYYTINTGS